MGYSCSGGSTVVLVLQCPLLLRVNWDNMTPVWVSLYFPFVCSDKNYIIH